MDVNLFDVLIEAQTYQCENCELPMVYKGGGRYVCENCGADVLTDFGRVKAYLEENGPSNAIEISDATGIPRRKIMDFIREGRVEIAQGDSDILFCEGCGKAIRYGTHCPECEKRMAANRGHGTFAAKKSVDAGKKRFEID